jgi:hypothetical protein
LDPVHPSDETEWDILGIPAQAIEAHLKDVRESVRAKLVCVCGHAVNKHTSTDGHVFCRTARMFCPCETITPVVEASDTRYFMTKTRGYGERHALSTGLFRLRKAGGTFKLLDNQVCFRCREASPILIPASLTREFALLAKPGPMNGLLCTECLTSFPFHFSYHRY